MRFQNFIKLGVVLLVFIATSGFVANDMAYFTYRSIENKAFGSGEELEFRVHYGWLNAASITMRVEDSLRYVHGRPTYKVVADGKTFRTFDWMYTVRDHFESYIDTASITPQKYYKRVREDNYRDVDLVFYSHPTKRLKGLKKDMDMPAYVQDLVSGIYYARTLDLQRAKVGQTFPIDIYLDQTIYNLKIKYLGKEVVHSDIGKVRCIKLRPQLVVDRVFKDEDDMTIWVTDDANRLPVRVQTDIWVGSLKVDLTSYKNLNNPLTSKIN